MEIDLKIILGWISVSTIFWLFILAVVEAYKKISQKSTESSVDRIEVCKSPNLFYNTKYEVSSYGSDPTFKHFKSKNKDHIILPAPLDKKYIIRDSPLLRRDRLHLKIAHKENIFTMHHEIRSSLCAFCHKKLYLYGFFALDYYFCFNCITTEIIPTYITERIFLWRELFSKWEIPDQSYRVIFITLSLCFDISQIGDFQFKCLDLCDSETGVITLNRCKIFQCDKCTYQTEFRRIDVYQYLLSWNPSNTQLREKIDFIERKKEEFKSILVQV